MGVAVLSETGLAESAPPYPGVSGNALERAVPASGIALGFPACAAIMAICRRSVSDRNLCGEIGKPHCNSMSPICEQLQAGNLIREMFDCYHRVSALVSRTARGDEERLKKLSSEEWQAQ